MTIRSTAPSFSDVASVETMLIQATAVNTGGITVRQDYLPVISDYRRKETVIWPSLKKYPANAPTIQEIRRTVRPQVGWVPRSDLAQSPLNPVGSLYNNLQTPGQAVKAITGLLDIDHFSRSMSDQQGQPWGDQIAKDTDDMIVSTMRFLERGIFTGNASNPGGLEFNGLVNLLPPAHTYTASIVTTPPDKVYDKLDEICMRAAMDVDTLRKITHIYCSGAGARRLTQEMKELQVYMNVQEISPGVKVPQILTAYGFVALVPSPYISDVSGGPGNNDTLNYWLVDASLLEWYGVYPYGGTKTFDPQIFDVSTIVNGQPLLEKRLVICYGTPFAKNAGQGLYKLEVTAPPGSTFNNG